MKLSKDELIAKVNEKVMDEDVKIELMEDITDSFDNETKSEDSERVAELEEKYKTLQEKYKERFLSSDKEDKEEKEDEYEEATEEEVVDIKEI